MCLQLRTPRRLLNQLRGTRASVPREQRSQGLLDEVALDLQKQSDAQRLWWATSDNKEKASTAREARRQKEQPFEGVDLAAERAVNAKDTW